MQLGRYGGELTCKLAAPALTNAALRTFERGSEALIRERLQHVVSGFDIERARRIATERRDEDHHRPLACSATGEIKPTRTRHLDVEQSDVDALMGQGLF